MRISDWSSDVCSSDLVLDERHVESEELVTGRAADGVGVVLVAELDEELRAATACDVLPAQPLVPLAGPPERDRKSVVSGKSVSVRVEFGGRRLLNKKKLNK